VQGAALHPDSGELWASEHGPQGGDEINRVLAGRNYGWPLLTFGRNYGSGTRIGEEGPKAGLRAAAEDLGADLDRAQRHGLPDQRPLPRLEGQPVHRCAARRGLDPLDAGRQPRRRRGAPAGLAERMRIRDVRQGPDGWLYLLTDNADGRLIRVER
jgi:glucose/arabinose dehydrogenase